MDNNFKKLILKEKYQNLIDIKQKEEKLLLQNNDWTSNYFDKKILISMWDKDLKSEFKYEALKLFFIDFTNIDFRSEFYKKTKINLRLLTRCIEPPNFEYYIYMIKKLGYWKEIQSHVLTKKRDEILELSISEYLFLYYYSFKQEYQLYRWLKSKYSNLEISTLDEYFNKHIDFKYKSKRGNWIYINLMSIPFHYKTNPSKYYDSLYNDLNRKKWPLKSISKIGNKKQLSIYANDNNMYYVYNPKIKNEWVSAFKIT